jgi:hypothetical protein
MTIAPTIRRRMIIFWETFWPTIEIAAPTNKSRCHGVTMTICHCSMESPICILGRVPSK